MSIVSSANPGIEIQTAAKQSVEAGSADALGSQVGALPDQVIVPDSMGSNNEGNLESGPVYPSRHFLLRPLVQLILGGGIAQSAVVAAQGSGYAVNDTLTVSGGTANNSATFNVDTIGGSGEVLTVSLVAHGDYTVTPTNPAATTVAPAGGTGATLTVAYEDGEELRFIIADVSQTLTVHEDWINIPVSGEDWAVSYILEDVATVNGLTLRANSGIFEASRRLHIGDAGNEDFAFFGMAEGKAMEINDAGDVQAGFVVTEGGYFVNGYLQGGVAINGGYLFGVNNGSAEDIFNLRDGGRFFFFDLQLRCALADLEVSTSTDTGASVRVMHGGKFFDAANDTRVDGWTIRDATFAATAPATNVTELDELTDIDGLTLINTQGFRSTLNDGVTAVYTVRNVVFVGCNRHVICRDDKTWNFVNPVGWINNSEFITFDPPDLNVVNKKFSIGLTAQEIDGTAIIRVLTLIYEGRANNNLPTDNQQLTDAIGESSSDILREKVDPAPISSTSFDAAIADDGGAFTDETTPAGEATANDMTLLPITPVTGDAYLFGLTRRFSGIELNVGTAGAGTWTLEWQYWNGSSFTAFDFVEDDTDDFQTAGLNTVFWNVPTNWEVTTVNGQGPFYYVRAVVNFTSITTQPLGTQADHEHTTLGFLADLFGDFALKVYKYGFTPFVAPQPVNEIDTPTGIDSTISMGDDAAILTASQAEAVEDSRGTVVKRQLDLPYDGQTVNFTVGATVRGIDSKATGVILADVDGGASGNLFLDEVIGVFEDDEEIRDDNATEGIADVNSALGGNKRPFNVIHYDGGTGTPAPAISDVITGGSSGETGTVVAKFGDVVSGTLILEQRSSTSYTNNEGLTSSAGGSTWAALADISGGGSSVDLDFQWLVDANAASSKTLTNVYEYLAALMAKRIHPLVVQEDNSGAPDFTDFTAAAKDDTIADVDLLPATPAANDSLYVGDQDSLFTSLYIDISTAHSTAPTGAWQYWNGSWTNLSGIDDETDGLQNTGMRRVSWTVPTDWATTSIDGTTAYWVRWTETSAGATQPVADQIWTDKTFEDVHIWGEDEVSQLMFSGADGFFSLRNVANAEGVYIANATSGIIDFLTADDGTQFVPPAIVTVKVTAVQNTDAAPIENARVLLRAAAGGPLPEDTEILNALTNASGIVQDTSFNFTSNQPVKGKVRRGTTSPLYKSQPLTGTITAAGYNVTAPMVDDE